MKKNEKNLTYFVILYVKSIYFLIARGVQLDNGVDPPLNQITAPKVDSLK